MDAEDARVRVCRAPAGRREEVDELRAHVVALRWKAREREAHASDIHRERARAVEEVNAWMLRESDLRDAATLVVARHDEHGSAEVRHARERLERLPRDAGRHLGAIEHVTAMDDDVDVPRERWSQRGRVIREEIGPRRRRWMRVRVGRSKPR